MNNTEQGQYVDGLRAPFVIHPSTEVHSYDAEYTVIMGDWYHQEHSTLLKGFISIGNPSGAEPIPGKPDKSLFVVGFRSSRSLCIGRLRIDILCPEWFLPRPNVGEEPLFCDFTCRVQRERNINI